jgi:hypothetical protein
MIKGNAIEDAGRSEKFEVRSVKLEIKNFLSSFTILT